MIHQATRDNALARRQSFGYDHCLRPGKLDESPHHATTFCCGCLALAILVGSATDAVGLTGNFTLQVGNLQKDGDPKLIELVTRLNKLAELHWEQRDYAKAEPLVKQVMDIRRRALGEKHADFAESRNNLAELYVAQGDYAKAEPLHKEALEIFRQVLGEKHPNFAASLNNLAELYREQGDYAKAEPLYKRVVENQRQVVGEKHPEFAFSLNNRGLLYQAQGDYAKAEPMFKQAMDLRRQVLGERHPDFATSLDNMAGLYLAQSNYAKAEPLVKQAMEIRRQILGEKDLDFAISLNNLAFLYSVQGDHAKAETLVKQSLEIRRQALGEKHPEFASSLISLAQVHRAQGHYGKAEALVRQALKIERQWLGERHPDFASSLNNLAILHQAQGDDAKAEPFARQAVQIMHENLENTAGAQSERRQLVHRNLTDRYIRNYLLTTAKLAVVPATYDLVLSWKGAVTARQRLTRLARTELDKDPQAKELFEQLDGLSRQISTWNALSSDRLPKGVDLPKKLAALLAEREDVEAKLSTRTDAFRKFKQSQKLTTAELQRQLPDGTVLVDFVEYGQKLAAFVVTKNTLERIELGLTKPIAEAVDRFRMTMKRGTPLTGKDDPARVLREKLLDPLDKYLSGAKLVLIAPDGPLHALPFAALPGKKEGKYWIEETPIAILPVPQMLPELLAKRDPARAKTPPSLLAIGEVDFDGALLAKNEAKADAGWKRQREGSPMKWERLPGTRGEVLAIEDTFRKAVPQGRLTVLREGQPTEATVRRLASQNEYLHFATHGFFAPKEVKSALNARPREGAFATDFGPRVEGHHPGLLSGIVLAGANKPTDDDDGVLTALEVAELDLRKTELAVLSACETGLGEVAGGEGVLGLQLAFQIAGARTTVTSLWKVDDEATRKLMGRFYDNYWKKNMGTLEALREAQIWLLQEGPTRGIVRVEKMAGVRRAPPFYWAAFVLSGDWR
ncbi:MAG: tetratricopeptide repeat protein [Gemmataceae bacterium]|nr:tetratricopeptide repeat protein [Gemmataceae bacterium]